MNKSVFDLFGIHKSFNLNDILRLPDYLDERSYKCRILYRKDIEEVEFLEYKKKQVTSLKLVHSEIEYNYKFENRDCFKRLLNERGDCDDILIIKENRATDSSYSNIVFYDGEKWFTPKHPLLFGTKRSQLLADNMLFERDIFIDEIKNYEQAGIINAMLDIGDILIPINNIK